MSADEDIRSDDLVDLLSSALDEVFVLRRALAYEARVIEAHYEGYKTFPKSRRKVAEEQVARMRAAVTGASKAYAGTRSEALRAAAKDCGFECLTSWQWKAEVKAGRAAGGVE